MWIHNSQGERSPMAEVNINDALQLATVIHNLISDGGKDKNLINHLLDSLEAINERVASDLY